MDLKDIIKSKDTVIIDVRSEPEFKGGHVPNSINIPLDNFPSKLEEMRAIRGNIVLCCATGNRSGMGTHFLRQQGLKNVYNGGGWRDVKFDLLD